MALRTIDKRTRRTVVLLALGGYVVLTPPLAHAAPIVVLDTLGTATPETTFSAPGSGGGGTVGPEIHIGPRFTLTQATTITEIGGFVDNCGGAQCPGPSPVIVEVRRSVNGVPELSAVLGSFTLSDDRDPSVWSYESAAPTLMLEPGVYFALFSSQIGSEQGFKWLTSRESEPYFAPVTTLGDVQFERLSFVFENPFAARILGETLPERPTTKDQCKNGGWRTFGVFKNQGDCVGYVATRGKNPPTRP
jgi:hypothetical protein